MASPSTNLDFLDLIRKSGLIEGKTLDEFLTKLRDSKSFPESTSNLAALLVREGFITKFQAEILLQGKWRRFHLGKYKMLERLGAGGMGSVYLCEHKLMRRRVAVKVLPAAKAEDPSSLERFYREARAVAALDHPNIVRAYDIDQDDKCISSSWNTWTAPACKKWSRRTGRWTCCGLPITFARRRWACSTPTKRPAWSTATSSRATSSWRNGIVKVLDMGLARFFNDEEDMLTKKYDEHVLGTADYLAPEQAVNSHDVDIRADIYSLGATFYFLSHRQARRSATPTRPSRESGIRSANPSLCGPIVRKSRQTLLPWS